MGIFNSGSSTPLVLIQQEGVHDVFLKSIKGCDTTNYFTGDKQRSFRFCFYKVNEETKEKEWTFLTILRSLDKKANLTKLLHSFIALSAQEEFFKTLAGCETEEESLILLKCLVDCKFSVKINANWSEKNQKNYYNIDRSSIEIHQKVNPYTSTPKEDKPEEDIPFGDQTPEPKPEAPKQESYQDFKEREEGGESRPETLEEDELPF